MVTFSTDPIWRGLRRLAVISRKFFGFLLQRGNSYCRYAPLFDAMLQDTVASSACFGSRA